MVACFLGAPPPAQDWDWLGDWLNRRLGKTRTGPPIAAAEHAALATADLRAFCDANAKSAPGGLEPAQGGQDVRHVPPGAWIIAVATFCQATDYGGRPTPIGHQLRTPLLLAHRP